MANYGNLNYWESRYLEQKEITFDWLEDYESLKGIFEGLIKNMNTENILKNNLSGSNLHFTPTCLMLGCGNSELSEKLYKEAQFRNMHNIDNSSNVIKTMKAKVSDMQWEVMDARDIKYSNSFFDLVIDKATMDSVLCGDNPIFNVALALKEVQRVLKTGGIYLLISYGEPDSRMPHLLREHLSFEINVQCLKKTFYIANPQDSEEHVGENSMLLQEKIHYVYVCKKKAGADSVCSENFINVYQELEKGEIIEEEEDFTQTEEGMIV